MLKVELHTHTADDPEDYIAHTAHQLIDRAAALDYDALAVTLHNKQLDLEPLGAYANERGLVLIPGVEREIEGKHVLLINFSGRAEEVDSFEKVARLKREDPAGLVIAPHPFFPTGSCLGAVMDRHAPLFDAVELNAMYSATVNFNRRAERWAAAHGRPMVGNGDVHLIEQLGTTYSLVDAEPSPNAICEAIRSGRVSVESVPLNLLRAAWLFARILPSGVLGSMRRARGL
jgi:predicted metal-dependent phosphoesterase TrpH